LQGFEVFLPQHDYSAVDLIVLNEKAEPSRIQVKYRFPTAKGRISISLDSIVNGKRIPIDRTKIDGWAVYVPTSREHVLYIPVSMVSPHKAMFTVECFDRRFVAPSILWKVSGLDEGARC
jgi:hypothetical protein